MDVTESKNDCEVKAIGMGSDVIVIESVMLIESGLVIIEDPERC